MAHQPNQGEFAEGRRERRIRPAGGPLSQRPHRGCERRPRISIVSRPMGCSRCRALHIPFTSIRIGPHEPTLGVPLLGQTAVVILAAGASSRFGRAKQLLDWNGKPLVAHVAGIAASAGFDPVVVVLGCQSREIEPVLSAQFPDEFRQGTLRIAMNWNCGEGLGSSIKAGLAALPPQTEAAILMQGDQPLVSADLLRTLASRFTDTGDAIVHPTVGTDPRPPALFARRLFPELAGLSDDQGGRIVIGRHAREAIGIELDVPDLVADIDTPQDYERLRAEYAVDRGHSPRPKDGAVLSRIRHLIIDMDGVLWHSDTPLPGLQQLFEFLEQERIGFTLATNNSSMMPRQYSAKLAQFGVDVSPEKVLTSSQATAAYVSSVAPAGARVYTIGGGGIRHALQQQGFVLTDEHAQYVVVGWDRQLTWDKLSTAALLIHGGAQFIGTNPDNSYPTERGPAPGNGAQLAALTATTNVEPVVVGKPEPWLYQEAMRRMGATPETTAAIGDRLETDIAGGRRAGVTTILLLSGIATMADLADAPIKPDLVLANIRELVRTWQEQLLGRADEGARQHSV